MESQKILEKQSNPEGGKKTNSGRTIIPDFKKYYRAIVIRTRTTWCWAQNGKHQWTNKTVGLNTTALNDSL